MSSSPDSDAEMGWRDIQGVGGKRWHAVAEKLDPITESPLQW